MFIPPGFPREWGLRKPQKIAILGNSAARQMPQGQGPEKLVSPPIAKG